MPLPVSLKVPKAAAVLLQDTKLVGASAPGWPLACRSLTSTLPLIGASVSSAMLWLSSTALGRSSTISMTILAGAELVVPSETLRLKLSVSVPRPSLAGLVSS
ncbi:hypothetical protein D3C72_1556320 [compost metagenome]